MSSYTKIFIPGMVAGDAQNTPVYLVAADNGSGGMTLATSAVVDPTGLATATLQTAGNASLTTIAAKDFATQTTLAAINTLLGTTGIKILKPQGAANCPTAQVAASTSASTLAIARPTRRGLLIRNTDAAISVYVGPATVTAENGMLLKAGESLPVTGVGL